MRQLLLRGLSGSSVCIALDSASTTVENVQERIFSAVGVPPEHQKLVLGGKVLTQDVLESVSASDVIFVSLSLRVVGGKGGFGSLLRGGQSGPNAKKITNFGSMRDLQGRRIKDVEKAKKLARAIAKANGEEVEDDPEVETNPKRRRRQVLRRKGPATQQTDSTAPVDAPKPTAAELAEVKYSQQRKEILQNVASAVEEGLKRAKEIKREDRKRKRQLAKSQPAKIFGDNLEDELLSSSDDEESDADKDEQGQTAANENDDDEYEWVSESVSDSEDEGEEDVKGNEDEGDESPSSRGLKRSHPDGGDEDAPEPQLNQASSSSSSFAANTEVQASSSPEVKQFDPIDLHQISSAKDLESYGLEHLKSELQRLGLLCGGNLTQRAERLFSVKGRTPDQYDPSIMAGNQAKRRKK